MEVVRVLGQVVFVDVFVGFVIDAILKNRISRIARERGNEVRNV